MPPQEVARVINRCSRISRGRCRVNAVSTALSGHSRRGRGVVPRSTATSCRSTSSSTSLVAGARPRSTSQPPSRTKFRYAAVPPYRRITPLRPRGQNHHSAAPRAEFQHPLGFAGLGRTPRSASHPEIRSIYLLAAAQLARYLLPVSGRAVTRSGR